MSEQPSIEPLKRFINEVGSPDGGAEAQAIAAYDTLKEQYEDLLKIRLPSEYDKQSREVITLRAQVAALTKERDEAQSGWRTMQDKCERLEAQFDQLSKHTNALEKGVKVAVEALDMWKSHWQSEEQDAEAEGESFSQAWHSTETAIAHLTPLLNVTVGGSFDSASIASEAAELLSKVHIVNDEPFPNQCVRVAIPDWFEKRRHVLDKISSQTT